MDNIEIWIHYGAPTSRPDDECFQAQGEAFQGWLPGRRTSLSKSTSHPSSLAELGERDMAGHDGRPSKQRACSQTEALATNTPHVPTYIDDVEVATRFLQSQLLSSVAKGKSSPRSTIKVAGIVYERLSVPSPTTRVLKTVTEVVETPHEQSILEPSLLPSTEDSHMKTPMFSRPDKRKRTSSDGELPRYRIRRHSPTGSSGERVQPGSTKKQQNGGNQTKDAQATSASKSNEEDLSTSILPTTYSLSDDKSKSILNSLQRSNSAPASVHASSSHSQPQQRRLNHETAGGYRYDQHEQAQSERSRRPQVDSPRSTAAIRNDEVIKQKSNDVVDEDETLSEIRSAAQSAHAGTTAHAAGSIPDTMVFIKSPQPPIKNESFKSHITSELDFLAKCKSMKDVYQPTQVTREIDISERGHWLCNISTFPTELQTRFWTFLDSFITKGSAGYMVLCCRGAEHEAEDDGTVKLYCYGEVAMHIYLLLYTASNSKVRKLGLQWKDSAGNVIIQMPKAS